MKILTLVKKSSLAVISAFVVMSSHGFGEYVVPELKTDDYAVYIYGMDQGDDKSAVHLFGSDGLYCYMKTKGETVSYAGGQWVRQGDKINITYHTPQRKYFALWNDWGAGKKPFVDVEKLTDHHGFGGQPFLLGFGDKTPTQIAIFNPALHDNQQSIPKGVKNVFVGENIKGKDGYALTAFSLINYDKIKKHKGGDRYFLSLASTPNMLSADEIAKRPKSFTIHLNTILLLDEIPSYSFVSNDTNTDVITMSNALVQCQGESPLRSLESFYQSFAKKPHEKAILPLLAPNSHTINYQGDIEQNATWLHAKQPD